MGSFAATAVPAYLIVDSQIKINKLTLDVNANSIKVKF